MSDIETLKAWCYWKRKEIERVPALETAFGEGDFVKAVEDVISQVGTFRAERDRLRAENERLLRAERDGGRDILIGQLRAELDALKAELDAEKKAHEATKHEMWDVFASTERLIIHERDQLKAEVERLRKVADAARGCMWINECRCDEAYTSRDMHGPNALCGEMDELAAALSALSPSTSVTRFGEMVEAVKKAEADVSNKD